MQKKRGEDKPDHIGEFVQLILLAIVRNGSKASGAEIWNELQTTAERETVIGAIYTTLDRLEEKGYVISGWEAPSAKPSERPRKVYKITDDGHRSLKRSLRAVNRMQAGLNFGFQT